MHQQPSFYGQIDSVVERARQPDGGAAAGAMLAELRQRMFGLTDDPLAVGPYRVLRKLGHGGMGVVYEAYDPRLDRRIALKIVKDSWVGETLRAGLVHEARSMARLSHPNVVTVHEVGGVDGEMFIAMELVDGEDLGSWQGERRSLRAKLDAYRQAAEGLLAAHRAGFAHGDFKPQNALIGKDGRVRVLDFGLARAAAAHHPGLEASLVGRLGDGETLLWGGTPAYMAPERYEGRPADERSDQFSYCVSLYEAVYGEHPFGEGASLVKALREGRVRPARAQSRVPARLRRCLLRGLAPNPDHRFATLADLLLALDRVSRRRQLTWAVAAASGAAVLGISLLWPRYAERRRALACNGLEGELAGLWDDATRARVAQAFAADSKPYAAASSRETEQLVSSYAQRWLRLRRSACELAQLHAGDLDSASVAINECLTARRAELRALVDELQRADDGVVRRAVGAASALRTPESCSDPSPLAGEQSAAAAGARVAILEQLAQADVLVNVGRDKQGLEIANAALARAREAGLAGQEAAAETRIGNILNIQSKYAKAFELLSSATWRAIRSGDDRLAANASGNAMFAAGALGRRAEGQDFRRLGEVLLARHGLEGGIQEAKLRGEIAVFLRDDGTELEEAERLMRAAIVTFEGTYKADHMIVANALVNLGTILGEAGKYEEARQVFARAKAGLEARLGNQHPRIVMALANMVNVEILLGNSEVARRQIEEAMAIDRQNDDKVHSTSCGLPLSLCEVLRQEGSLEQAEAHCQTALDLCKRVFGEESPAFAETMSQAAELSWKSGRVEEARGLAERALAIYSQDPAMAKDAALPRAVLARVLFRSPAERKRAVDLAKGALPLLGDVPRWRAIVAELSPLVSPANDDPGNR